MKKLIDAAMVAQERAYAPYSHFPVGAALLTIDGEVVLGCNVENVSYGLTNCAERTALFHAISDGYTQFLGMAIIANTRLPISPCGACRQVMSELCSPDMPIWLATTLSKEIRVVTVQDLLPFVFNKEDLHGK